MLSCQCTWKMKEDGITDCDLERHERREMLEHLQHQLKVFIKDIKLTAQDHVECLDIVKTDIDSSKYCYFLSFHLIYTYLLTCPFSGVTSGRPQAARTFLFSSGRPQVEFSLAQTFVYPFNLERDHLNDFQCILVLGEDPLCRLLVCECLQRDGVPTWAARMTPR